jgi:hypothetical protein
VEIIEEWANFLTSPQVIEHIHKNYLVRKQDEGIFQVLKVFDPCTQILPILLYFLFFKGNEHFIIIYV